ncbi:hypothetical protein LTI14_04325 [Nesterenkonia sp. YGD6]|uniref:hypothetical protein n=1 Tax=Nesterenkonia sp. YGD6 TaxID=2901231 RepID=UPI001F4CF7A3|nr:hypothetical protein [Nesterenkonia sp. YGD6]MCH8562449.1 hypothetical protein [Nesterenkonia sp. YGD6]
MTTYEPLVDVLDLDSTAVTTLIPNAVALLRDVSIAEVAMRHTPFGPLLTGSVILDEPLVLRLAGVPVSLVLNPNKGGALMVRAVVSEDWFIEIEGTGVGFRLESGLLHPLDPEAGAPEISVTGGLRITPDDIELLDPTVSLSLPPCEIARTGIILSLTGIIVDGSTETTPAEIAEHGYEEAFRGVYAQSGSIRFLPMLRFGAVQGLEVQITDLLIGEQGVACAIHQEFNLLVKHSHVDPASERLGHLISADWSVGIESIDIDIEESTPVTFRVQGLLEVPLLSSPLGLAITMRQGGEGDWNEYAASVTSWPATLRTPLGNITHEGASFEGALTSDVVTLNGVMSGLTVALPSLTLRVQTAFGRLQHQADGDELRLSVEGADLGPLGYVERVALVITEWRDGGQVGRDIRAEATLLWQNLKARLGLPPLLPTPTDSTVVQASITWFDDPSSGLRRMNVQLGAHVADVAQLWSFLPSSWRPQVEEARLEAEIVYTDPDARIAASANDPLSGSGSVSVVVRLPMLLTIPGVLAVQTGDSDGRVRATLRVTEDGDTPQIALELTDPVALDLAMPGSARPTASLVQLEVTKIELSNGKRPGSGRFVLAGSVMPSAMDDYLNGLAGELGLPTELGVVLQPLGQAVPGGGTFSLAVESDGAQTEASIELAFYPGDPPRFLLLEALGRVVNPNGAPTTAATALPGLSSPADFFEVAPSELRLAATLSDELSIRLSGSLETKVFGETFDMTIALKMEPGDFGIFLTAGSVDPIHITAPIPDPTVILGAADVAAIAATYGLDVSQRVALAAVDDFLTDLAGELGSQGVFAFEISNLGLSVTSAGPTVEGSVRLIQLPRFVEALTPLTELHLELGAEIDKVFVRIVREGTDSSEPFLRLPLPGDVSVEVNFRNFLLAYAWGRNEFAFALDADVVPTPELDMTVGGSGVILPAATFDVQLGATATAPPAPLPEGIVSFRPPQRSARGSALGELGLQAIVGVGNTRLVTTYLRDVAFSPTYFLLWPGFRGDGGLVLGGPNPVDSPNAEAYLDASQWDRGAFFARFTVENGSLIFIDPLLGLMLNPLAVIPPFVTANPPYWIAPPLSMGDLYADRIGISGNLPGLAFFDLTFERPLPAFSLQALLELAALAAGGFAHAIPDGSPLREVFFARLTALLQVHLPGLSSQAASARVTLEVNVADFVNGAIDLMQKAKGTLDAGADLLDLVAKDPGALVRMIPPEARRVEHVIDLGGFKFSGSLYLLSSDELHDELVLFFENKRRRPRGIAANWRPPATTGMQPVNESPTLESVRPVHRETILDPRSIPPDAGRIAARAAAKALAGRRIRAEKIDKLEEDRRRNMDAAANALVGALSAIPLTDARARKKALARFEMAEVTSSIEAAVAGLIGRGVPLNAATVAAKLRPVLIDAITKRDEVVVADSRLLSPPAEMANSLIGRLLQPDPASRALAVSVPWTHTALFSVREQALEVERLVPDGGPLRARREVGKVLGQLKNRLADAGATGGDAELAIASAHREITKALAHEFGAQSLKFPDIPRLDMNVEGLAASIRDTAMVTWGTPPRLATRTETVGTFHGKHFADVVAHETSLFAPPRQNPTETVEEVVGYEIRQRTGGSFAVPVQAATAIYKVVVEGDRYRLRVRGRDRTWTAHDLPAAMVSSVPNGPAKAGQLRDQLLVAPRVVSRPPTRAENDAVQERFEQSDDLYLTSILAREEYRIKRSGGIHGAFYFADLLRNSSTGRYTVPAEPALLGGFSTKFGNDTLQLAGMVVGGGAKPSAFLYGHSVVSVVVGSLRLRAEGEFVASSGALWQSVPLPSGAMAAQNAVGFCGHVTLLHDNKAIFEGAATGHFSSSTGGEDVSASLDVHVTSDGSYDLEVAETKLARLAWSTDGNLQVKVTPRTIDIASQTTASVSVDVMTFGTRWVVDVPAQTLCIPWYDISRWRWTSLCTKIPEVGHWEFDFSRPNWLKLDSGRCAMSASVSEDGVTFTLDLDRLNDAARNALRSSRIALPTNLI